jgi:hypothetical protein
LGLVGMGLSWCRESKQYTGNTKARSKQPPCTGGSDRASVGQPFQADTVRLESLTYIDVRLESLNYSDVSLESLTYIGVPLR